MMNKPPEYWAVLLGMILYAATRDAESEPLWRRGAKVLCSALLALGLSAELVRFAEPWITVSESIATVAIMAVGLIVLDVLVAIVADREFIRGLIAKRLGRKTDGNE
jgi:hypothetical protein